MHRHSGTHTSRLNSYSRPYNSDPVLETQNNARHTAADVNRNSGAKNLSPEPLGQNPAPNSLHPAPSTVNAEHYSLVLHPTPYTLRTPHPTPYTLHPSPFTLHPTPYTLLPSPSTLHPTLILNTLQPTPHTHPLHPIPDPDRPPNHRAD